MLEPGSSAPQARLRDDEGGWLDLPRPGVATLIVFYRGDWCPWCNGQLASLARRLEGAPPGGEVVAVSVDPSGRNRAMRAKLRLPFPLLSDPDGELAIEPYGAWDGEERLARPVAVLVDAEGSVRRVWNGRGAADRADPEEMLAALEECA